MGAAAWGVGAVARPKDDERPRVTARLTGEALEQQRRADRTSLVSAAAASYGENSAVNAAFSRLGIETVSLEESLSALAQATEDETRVAPRVAVLDMLVRLASRQGRAPFEESNQAMTDLLRALVREGRGRHAPDVEQQVEELRAAFQSAGTGHAGITNAWAVVQPTVVRALNLTEDEEHAPRCMDEVDIVVNGYEATQISVEFTTTRTVQQMARWADPRNWPTCSVYFSGMQPLQGPTDYTGTPGGWDGKFLEMVDYPGRVLETPLEFFYREDFANGMVSSEYSLPGATNEIDVDEGFVEAVADSGDPDRPTRVRCLKIIRFRDPDLQATASIACDTFWIELSMNMALDCSGGGPV